MHQKLFQLKSKKHKSIIFKIANTQHLILKARVNGVLGNFILDTGASNCCIGYHAVEKFNLQTQTSSTKAASASHNDLDTHLSFNNHLKINRFIQHNCSFVILDLEAVNFVLKQHKTKAIDGIIGADLLINHQAIIDYQNLKLFLLQ